MINSDEKPATDMAESGPVNNAVQPLGVVADFMLDLFREFEPPGTSPLMPVAASVEPPPAEPRLPRSSKLPAGNNGPICDTDQARPASMRRSQKSFSRPILLLAALVAVACGVGSIGLAHALSTTRTKYAAQEQKLSRYDYANRLTVRSDEERDDAILVRHIDPNTLASMTADERNGSVTLTARNIKYMCTLQWTVNEKTQSVQLPTGDTTVELSIATPVILYCRPHKTNGWIQTVQVWLKRGQENATLLGSALGNIPLMLQDGDEVIVFFETPIPLWNAVEVPIGEETLMVTLERPQGMRDVDKWLAGEWDAEEEFPNAPMFWARDGSEGMAHELAAYFIANRHDPEKPYSFRGKRHTSLQTYSDGKSVSPLMQQITQEELGSVLFEAFEQLRTKESPLGDPIQDEIEHAAELLYRNN